MKLWIIFILLYGILKGSREPIKKAVLKDVGVLTSLFVYTFVGFLMSAPTAVGVFSVTPFAFLLVVIKSFVIFVAWILAFLAIKKVPVSVYGICDMSRVIFSTLLGVFFLGESLTAKGVVSLILVACGLYFANTKKSAENENYKMKYIWLIIIECFLNAVSGTMDKYIMSTGEITASALQFWFMLLLSVVASIVYAIFITAPYKLQNEKLINVNRQVIFLDKNGVEFSNKSNGIEITTYSEIPKNLINAFIATEDKRFYKHKGIDYKVHTGYEWLCKYSCF